MSSMKKIIFTIVLIIILTILYLFTGTSDNKKSNKFIGSVRSVGDNSFVVFGAFEDEIKLGKPQYEYEIGLDSTVKIVKNSFVMPAGGEMFVVADLPKKIREVDFEILKKDSQNIAIGIEVTLTRNFLGMVQNKAQEIIYIGPEY